MGIGFLCGAETRMEKGDRARAEPLIRELGELGERTRDNQPLVESLELEILLATIDGGCGSRRAPQYPSR